MGGLTLRGCLLTWPHHAPSASHTRRPLAATHRAVIRHNRDKTVGTCSHAAHNCTRLQQRHDVAPSQASQLGRVTWFASWPPSTAGLSLREVSRQHATLPLQTSGWKRREYSAFLFHTLLNSIRWEMGHLNGLADVDGFNIPSPSRILSRDQKYGSKGFLCDLSDLACRTGQGAKLPPRCPRSTLCPPWPQQGAEHTPGQTHTCPLLLMHLHL